MEDRMKLLGTSHIARQSIREIEQVIEEWHPDIVAVELDVQRAEALLQEKERTISWKAIGRIGVKGFLFALLGQYIQQKLGKMVGTAPGSEMKTALLAARKRKLQIALIDQPIALTLKQFSRQLRWREKGRFVLDVVKGLFFREKQLEKMGWKEMDLTTVPSEEMIARMMEQLKERYPSVYKVLVEDRNKYMVRQLVKLLRAQPEKKILCIVGAAHVGGMKKLLQNIVVMPSRDRQQIVPAPEKHQEG